MKTVLIVDDEFGVAEVLAAALSDMGYRAAVAVNGEDGLVQLGQVAPDVVVVDYMMPFVDGATMIKRLREDARYARLPVVLMSAVEERRIGATGYQAFLRKPFTLDALLDVLGRVLADATDATDAT